MKHCKRKNDSFVYFLNNHQKFYLLSALQLQLYQISQAATIHGGFVKIETKIFFRLSITILKV